MLEKRSMNCLCILFFGVSYLVICSYNFMNIHIQMKNVYKLQNVFCHIPKNINYKYPLIFL